jgi:hypothetical protein
VVTKKNALFTEDAGGLLAIPDIARGAGKHCSGEQTRIEAVLRKLNGSSVMPKQAPEDPRSIAYQFVVGRFGSLRRMV